MSRGVLSKIEQDCIRGLYRTYQPEEISTLLKRSINLVTTFIETLPKDDSLKSMRVLGNESGDVAKGVIVMSKEMAGKKTQTTQHNNRNSFVTKAFPDGK